MLGKHEYVCIVCTCELKTKNNWEIMPSIRRTKSIHALQYGQEIKNYHLIRLWNVQHFSSVLFGCDDVKNHITRSVKWNRTHSKPVQISKIHWIGNMLHYYWSHDNTRWVEECVSNENQTIEIIEFIELITIFTMGIISRTLNTHTRAA